MSRAYEDRQQLINLIQNDYAHIRQELLNMSSSLHEREMKLSKLLTETLTDLDQTGDSHDSRFDRHSKSMHSTKARGGGGEKSPVNHEGYVPSLKVRCLGKFHVLVGDKEIVNWRSLKAKSLLKYLIGNNGRSVSRDMLMEALWPGCEPSTANNNLKVAVLALRKTLESNHSEDGTSQLIVFRDGNYSVNPGVSLYVDIEQFEYRWQAGKRLERQAKDDEAITEYEAAIDMYRGDFLEDDLYEDWTVIRRETLKDKYLTILSKLADYSVQKADYEGAVTYCEKMLEKDRCREDVYRRLMICYSQMGQRNRAIEWYRLCEKTIRRELDIGPDQGLAVLHEKLVRGESIRPPIASEIH